MGRIEGGGHSGPNFIAPGSRKAAPHPGRGGSWLQQLGSAARARVRYGGGGEADGLGPLISERGRQRGPRMSAQLRARVPRLVGPRSEGGMGQAERIWPKVHSGFFSFFVSLFSF